jgi:hypothetical protein
VTVIAELTVPADAPPPRALFPLRPGIEISLDRFVPTEMAILPHFWVRGENVESFLASMRRRPAVRSLSRIETVGDRTLCRAVWQDSGSGFARGVSNADATRLRAVGTVDGWTFEIWAAARESVTALANYFTEQGCELTVDGESVTVVPPAVKN